MRTADRHDGAGNICECEACINDYPTFERCLRSETEVPAKLMEDCVNELYKCDRAKAFDNKKAVENYLQSHFYEYPTKDYILFSSYYEHIADLLYSKEYPLQARFAPNDCESAIDTISKMLQAR